MHKKTAFDCWKPFGREWVLYRDSKKCGTFIYWAGNVNKHRAILRAKQLLRKSARNG